jgi:hypothetical protein
VSESATARRRWSWPALATVLVATALTATACGSSADSGSESA